MDKTARLSESLAQEILIDQSVYRFLERDVRPVVRAPHDAAAG